MTIEVLGSKITGEKQAILSKSFAHRVMICSYLAGHNFNDAVSGFSSEDIEATKNCLNALNSGNFELDCNESGSTLRFIIPLVMAIGGKYTLNCKGRLIDRPNDELFNVLLEHGVKVEKKDSSFIIEGKLTAGEYKIRGDISSQYISGLLMALPLLDGDSKIVLTSPLVSKPYVEITKRVMSDFGVLVNESDKEFTVLGNQKYCGKSFIEGDWSNEAFFLVLGALSGKISVKGLNQNSLQGDKYILEILRRAGVKFIIDNDCVTVEKSKILPFEYDAENCPDLVPITAVLASFANGESMIKNVSRLKIKESDRIQSTIEMLKGFNVKAFSDGVDLTVCGGTAINGKADSFNDHRIAMSSCVLATAVKGTSIISGAKAVNKSYPSFYEDLKSVGGNVNEI